MPKEIYNEGRVVGMSAYEIFLRHFLSKYPDEEPMTEREWLASMLGSGAAMVLKIPKSSGPGIFEKELPENSKLCATSTITASFFDGQVATDSTDTWGTYVKSYKGCGGLIENNAASHPQTPGDSVPNAEATRSEAYADYLHVTDGIVYQPGQWEETEKSEPFADLMEPNFHKSAKVRLYLSEKLKNDLYILLTGWVDKRAVQGCIKTSQGSVDLVHPENGDFLGPERFPWCAKIIFTVNNNAIDTLVNLGFSRIIDNKDNKAVTARPIIDYESANLDTFYNNEEHPAYPDKLSKSRVPATVTQLSSPSGQVSTLAAYQGTRVQEVEVWGKKSTWSDADFPPALYGMKATALGDKHLVPIDTCAPGTIKVFDHAGAAKAYTVLHPNTYGLHLDRTYGTVSLMTPSYDVFLDTKVKTLYDNTTGAYQSIVQCGQKSVHALSLFDDKGNPLPLDGRGGSAEPVDGKMNGLDVISMLCQNETMDLIGSELRKFRKNLPNIVSDGGYLWIKGSETTSAIEHRLDAGYLAIKTSREVRGGEDRSKDIALRCWGHVDVYGELWSGGGLVVDTAANTDDGLKTGGSSYNLSTRDKDGVIKCGQPIRSGSNYIEFKQPKGDPLRLYIARSAPGGDIPEGSIGIGW